ncbi:MAG: thioredoxin fold domain-containing protein [Candidatus Omnitrophica bacterium]|nr:thioredoxin fold domain-containing protein [Candidatus Omnitrophota bacterium]MBU4477521.1 thioredoxin fold domain-containing protein [Candidatus Omnitrophota bacterium]
MKKFLFFAVLFCLIGCGQAQDSARAEHIAWIRDMSVAKDLAQKNDKPILIDFYTEWCGWCKKLDKDTYGDARVIAAVKEFVCAKIDAEKNQALARQYKVQGFPTTVFLDSEGNLIEAIPGYMTAEQFLEVLNKISESLRGSSG